MSNQASEDELTLERLLKFLCGEEPISGRWFGEKYEGEPAFWWRPELKRLIRTEKLKLLAEVRERVVGEDLPPDVATDSGIGYSRQQFAINMGKAGQRTKLTQLEAEL